MINPKEPNVSENSLRSPQSALLTPQSRYVLPSFVERTSYGIKEMNPYNKLFEERIIFLGVQIDDASANDVMAQLLTLEAIDPERENTMDINSPGGTMPSPPSAAWPSPAKPRPARQHPRGPAPPGRWPVLHRSAGRGGAVADRQAGCPPSTPRPVSGPTTGAGSDRGSRTSARSAWPGHNHAAKPTRQSTARPARPRFARRTLAHEPRLNST